MSPDGENFTSVGTVENVSEFVYTPATDFDAYHFKVVQTVGEQSVESNVVSVVKPVEDIVISAEAVYDEDSGNVTVKWTTSNPNGTFDILMSSDGESFASVGTVENATEFIYAPTEDFETLYFQVKQTYKNQAAESNVVAVANSAEDIAISADAEYDTENNNVIVEWTSNKENGKFEIFVSEDGESYTSIAVVEDVVEYVYTPENEFEVLYFKVKQTTGLKSAESNIAMVSYDEEEHIDDVLSWDEMVDTDGDGLPDYVEADYETDINNTDTDGDGLSDGYEVLNCGTDPSLYDTDGNGINDGNEDLDCDKLSNLEECKLGTTPIVNDSDHDGLNDGDEVNIYNTQPLVYDSDSDGISDGDEVTKELNPNNAATFGVPDSEYTFEQPLTADNIVFDLINYDENPFSMSLKVNAAGNAENSISVSQSGYSIIIENEYILGCVPEIVYDENLKIDNIEISFDIAQDYLVDMYSSNKLSGIHKYNIFMYNEDLNMIMPVVTEYDVENNRISTTTDNVGTYFVVDMNKWIEQLGIESVGQETNANSTFSTNNNVALMSKQNSSVADNEYIDVAFLIYNTQQYSNVVKKQLTTTVEAMYSNYDNIRVFFVVYTGGAYVCGLTGNPYAESVEEAANIINRLSFTPTSTTITTVKGFTAITELEWRENSKRHMFMIDALIEPMCKFDMPSFTNIADNGINVAICYDAANANASTYKAMTVNTYGNVVGLDRYLIPLITFPEKDDVMLMSTNLLPVELDEEITKGYAEAAEELYYNEEIRNTYVGYADTDKDGLYDFEEINFDAGLISFESDKSVKLPTFAECLAATKNNKIISAFDVYKDEAFYDEIMEKHILIVNSDLLSEDGDGDGILDFDEAVIIKKETKNNSQTINTFAVTANKDSDGDGISDDVDKAQYKLNPAKIDNVVSIFATEKKKVITSSGNEDYENQNEDDIIMYSAGIIGSETDIVWIELSAAKSTKNNKIVNKIRFHINYKYYESGGTTDFTMSDVCKNETSTALFKEQLPSMLNSRWNLNEYAQEYDFYKGMWINTKIVLDEVDDDPASNKKEYIKLTIHTNECGVSHSSGINRKSLDIYNSQCKIRSSDITKTGDVITKFKGQTIDSNNRVEEVTNGTYKIIHGDTTNTNCTGDKNKSNVNYCLYQDHQKDYDTMCNTLAHEFGHVLGLADNYVDSNHNIAFHNSEKYWLLSFSEISKLPDSAGTPAITKYKNMVTEFGKGDLLMHNNGKPTLNDVEMAIYAYKDGSFKMQYYTPTPCNKKGHNNISKAIRSRILLYYKRTIGADGKPTDTLMSVK